MSNTPMEKIKSYHSIKSFLNEGQRVEVAQMLNLTEEDLNRRLDGKEAEYEFLLSSYLMGNIKHIIAFEEGISRLTNTTTADFLIVTNNGKRLIIEVKSTDNTSWKISKKVFQEKKEFAEMMNGELYFAIRIKGHWLLLSGDYVETKNYKIEIGSYLDSELHILGSMDFIFRDKLIIKSVYTRDEKRSLGIQNTDHGYLERYTIETNKKTIFKISPSTKDKIYISFALEAIQDSASNHSQEIIDLGKGRTLVIEELMEDCQFALFHLLLAPIKHIINSNLELNYEFSTYIAEIVDSNNGQFINKEQIGYVLALLHKSGVDIHVVIGGKIYRFDQIYDTSVLE